MAAEDQEAVNWIFVHFGKAVAAYMRQLVSRDAPFDKYVAGDSNAISEQAKKGLKLFVSKAQCVVCHNTPFFSHNGFHNIGMRPEGPHIDADAKGRYDVIESLLANPFNVANAYSDDSDTGKLRGLTQNEEDIGRWRTKSLRQIAKTPPYMRYGQFATLREVIDFYDTGGHADGFHGTKSPLMRPLGLTEQEKEQVVAFLKTLTGAQVAARLLKDTSVP
jgi:cytochrome c peroxidase